MIHSQPKQADASSLNRRAPSDTRMIEDRIFTLHVVTFLLLQ